MYKPNLYWDLLALGLVLAGAGLVAALVWLLMRKFRKEVAHSVACTPPKLCSPVTSPPQTDGSSPLMTERQTSLLGPSNQRMHKTMSQSAIPDAKEGGSEQRPNPKAASEPGAEDRMKRPADPNDQQKECQSKRKKSKSDSADEKSCSSKVKRRPRHREEAATPAGGAKPSGAARPGAEAGSVVAAWAADGGAASVTTAGTSPTGANLATPVPASQETPASLRTPGSLYTTASVSVSAAASFQLVSPSMKGGENPLGLVSATPSSVPSSITPLATPLCELLASATAEPQPRRRRSTRSKGSKGSGSSRRSDHHHEPQAHPPTQPQPGAIPRDPSVKRATEDAAQRLFPVPSGRASGTDSRAATREAQAELPAGASSACSQLESRRISTHSFVILTVCNPASEDGVHPASPEDLRSAEAGRSPPPMLKPNPRVAEAEAI